MEVNVVVIKEVDAEMEVEKLLKCKVYVWMNVKKELEEKRN